MKAKLKITNVGGLAGEHSYELSSGSAWMLQGSNSGGKSSFVRALTAILAIPEDGDLGKFAEIEARTLGIKTEDQDPKEGFVNIHSNFAEVLLSSNGDSSKYAVKQDGKYVDLPSGGDPRFLLAGILSNESKILRQLKNVDSQTQPNDFRWAVNELSYASKYEDVRDVLNRRLEDVDGRLVVFKRRLDSYHTLIDKKKELEKKEKRARESLESLSKEYKGVESQLKAQEKHNEELSNLVDAMSTLEGSVSNVQRGLSSMEKRLKKVSQEIAKKKEKLSSVDLRELTSQYEERESEIEKEVAELIEERSSLDGILNLLITASASVKGKEGNVSCPLCEEGSFSIKALDSRLGKTQHEKEDFNRKIAGLNLEKRKSAQGLDKKKDEYKELKSELGQLMDEKGNIEWEYQEDTSKIKGELDRIEKYKARIDEKRKKVQELAKQLGPEDSEIKKLLNRHQTEFEQILKDIGEINRGLEESAVEVGGRILKPEVGLQVLTDWKEYLTESIDYCARRAEEQRQMAASEFNNNIESMMKALGFKEFRTIMLDRNYRLYVERLDKKTKKYKSQRPETLSTSEKLSIALILQVALKETYIPEVPFFIVDDVMEDFDGDRREAAIKYLANKAKDEDWCIVITKVVKKLSRLELIPAS